MLKRVYLEITNACNLDCPFCTNEKGNTFLSLNLIENYIRQIKKYTDYIYLHIIGEPLLHPEFNQILDFLDANDMKLQLVTNGTLLYKYPDLCRHSCIRKLSISVHSINNISIDDNYFKVIDSLIKKERNFNLELRFYNTNNISLQVESYLNELKNKYIFETTSKNNSYRINSNTYVYFEELFKWPNINDEYVSNIGTCKGGIDMIAINCLGDVTLCCLDPKAYNNLGNLNNMSLDEIINSKKYKDLVDDFKNNKITSKLCSKCTYRLRF